MLPWPKSRIATQGSWISFLVGAKYLSMALPPIQGFLSTGYECVHYYNFPFHFSQLIVDFLYRQKQRVRCIGLCEGYVITRLLNFLFIIIISVCVENRLTTMRAAHKVLQSNLVVQVQIHQAGSCGKE